MIAKPAAVPTDAQIARYARAQARKAGSVRRVDPAGAERIIAAAQARCEEMRAAQRAARDFARWERTAIGGGR